MKTEHYKPGHFELFFGLLDNTLGLEEGQFKSADQLTLKAIRKIAEASNYSAEDEASKKVFLTALFEEGERVELFAFILQSYVRAQDLNPSLTNGTDDIVSSFYELHKALAKEFVHSLDQSDTKGQSKRFEVVMNAVAASKAMLKVFDLSPADNCFATVIELLDTKAAAVSRWRDKVSCGEKCILPSTVRAFDKVGVALWVGLTAMCLVAAVLLLANPVGAGMGAAAFTTVVAMNLLGASSGIINVASGVRNLLKPSQPVKDRAKVEKKATVVENGLFSKLSSEKQDAEKAQPASTGETTPLLTTGLTP